jgi:hypothetical protein
MSFSFPSLCSQEQVAGKVVREVEIARTAMTAQWLGDEITQIMADGGKFFDDMGGYPLPKPRG